MLLYVGFFFKILSYFYYFSSSEYFLKYKISKDIKKIEFGNQPYLMNIHGHWQHFELVKVLIFNYYLLKRSTCDEYRRRWKGLVEPIIKYNVELFKDFILLGIDYFLKSMKRTDLNFETFGIFYYFSGKISYCEGRPPLNIHIS